MKINSQIQEILNDFKDEKHGWVEYHELLHKCFEMESEDWEKLKTLSNLYKKNTLIHKEIIDYNCKWEDGTFHSEFINDFRRDKGRIELIEDPVGLLDHYLNQFPENKKCDQQRYIENHIKELFPDRDELVKTYSLVARYLELKRKQLTYLDELSYVKELEVFIKEEDWNIALDNFYEGW